MNQLMIYGVVFVLMSFPISFHSSLQLFFLELCEISKSIIIILMVFMLYFKLDESKWSHCCMEVEL